jgi:hypothetical protein
MAGAKAIAAKPAAKGSAPKAAAAKPAARKGGGGSLTLLLLGVVFGAVLTFATPTALLCCVLLAPAILVAVLDATPNKSMARVVFVAGAGFSFAPIWHLNTGGGTMAVALDMLSNPSILCPAWLAGACGWAVCECLPLLLRSAANRAAEIRIASLAAEAQKLREEWDLDS